MYDWRLVNMAQEHCNDLLREAEQERLVKLALQGRGSRGNLYNRVLLGLGRRLAALEPHLHPKHGGVVERPVLGSARSRPA